MRNKWCTEKQEINVNDLVMVKDETLPSTKWALGRIIEKHPGPDGRTRVVSVKTGKNVIKRTITKIAPMPLKIDHINTEPVESTVKNKKPGFLTILLGALTMLSTTEAHKISLFKNDQILENKQNINVSVKQSENFALLIIFSIFCVFLFLFLMYLVRILYDGASTQTATQQQTNETESTEIPMAEIVTPDIQQMSAPPGFILPNSHEQLNITRLQIPHIPQAQTISRIPTPVPAKRSKISPIVKLEREFYESRRASVTTIYPILDLKKMEDIKIKM